MKAHNFLLFSIMRNISLIANYTVGIHTKTNHKLLPEIPCHALCILKERRHCEAFRPIIQDPRNCIPTKDTILQIVFLLTRAQTNENNTSINQ